MDTMLHRTAHSAEIVHEQVKLADLWNLTDENAGRCGSGGCVITASQSQRKND